MDMHHAIHPRGVTGSVQRATAFLPVRYIQLTGSRRCTADWAIYKRPVPLQMTLSLEATT